MVMKLVITPGIIPISPSNPTTVVREEISRAEVILNELTGQSPRPLWRAPYGERDDRVLRIASNLGYRSIYWTLDSLDGVEPIKTPQFLIDRITHRSDQELDGAIILMHVGVQNTAEVGAGKPKKRKVGEEERERSTESRERRKIKGGKREGD